MVRSVVSLCLALGIGCAPSGEGTSDSSPAAFRGWHAHTLLLGPDDNAEVVQAIPHTKRALLLASKARELVLLEVSPDGVRELRARSLLLEDPTESELTHLAVAPTGEWAAVTRTIVDQGAEGQIVGCRGELLLVDTRDAPSFGDLLSRLSVGPMPDAVAVTQDGNTALVANERDAVWGKCDGAAGLEPPSLSIVDLSRGPESATERTRLEMQRLDREPEAVAFGADGDLFVATLQDSHEVAFGRLSELTAIDAPTDSDLTITSLPPDLLGEDAWPDGVARVGSTEAELFAVAGEANDTVTLLGADSAVVTQLKLTSDQVPAAYPRDGSWGTSWFTPDSVAGFMWGERAHLAVTLKAVGAVAIWEIDDLSAIGPPQVIKVGRDEGSGRDLPSTIAPEGITAAADGSFLLTANEGESSVSLILSE